MSNKLEKLFDRLREDGWFCGWARCVAQIVLGCLYLMSMTLVHLKVKM